MHNPLISIIIPTCGRPQFLGRAVHSAFAATEMRDVEVIVVPNGPDESWKQTLEPFSSDVRVRAEPIRTAHANAARNHGMKLARGKYLRFLDDDDYLLPGAARQIETLEDTQAEICSGLICNIDQNGLDHGLLTIPQTRDFVCAATSLSGLILPVGNVFLRSALNGCQWDVRVNRAQDYVWMMHLAAQKEWEWARMDELVGAWYQHDRARLSTLSVAKDRETPVINQMLFLHQQLNADGRLTNERAHAIAQGLWQYINHRFPGHPLYWSRLAVEALAICPDSRPIHPLFHSWAFRHLNALVVEWILFPGRIFTMLYRQIKHSIVGWDYRRQL